MVKLAVIAVAAVAVAALPSQAAETVYWADVQHPPRVEPKRVFIATGTNPLVAKKLKWKGWGSAKATGRGVIHRPTCDPSCADGGFEDARGKIILSQRTDCGDRTHYLRITTRRVSSDVACDGTPDFTD